MTQYWSGMFGDLNWGNVWNLPYRYLLTNKLREVSYKLIHRYYPAEHYLLKFKKDICVNCSLCETEPETVKHLFWQCHFTATFWSDVIRFIKMKIDSEFSLSWNNVLFGFHNVKSKKQKELYIINLIIITGKYHIHKAKFSHSKPSFLAFQKKTEQYINSISDSTNKKAIKTYNLCSLFDIFLCKPPG